MEKNNLDKEVAVSPSTAMNCSTRRGYERRLCNVCGDGLGFSEAGNICEKCIGTMCEYDHEEVWHTFAPSGEGLCNLCGCVNFTG